MLDKTNSDDMQVKTIMRKAYIVHAATAFFADENSGEKEKAAASLPDRSFFSIQYKVSGIQHIRYIDQFKQF